MKATKYTYAVYFQNLNNKMGHKKVKKDNFFVLSMIITINLDFFVPDNAEPEPDVELSNALVDEFSLHITQNFFS